MSILTKDYFWYRLLFLLARALIRPDEVDELLKEIDRGMTWRQWQRNVAGRLVLAVAQAGCVFYMLRARGCWILFHLAVWSVRKSLGRAISVVA